MPKEQEAGEDQVDFESRKNIGGEECCGGDAGLNAEVSEDVGDPP